MRLWHGYLNVKKPTLMLGGTWKSRKTLYEGSLGNAETDPQPAKRLHWRESNNGSQVIYEGTFNLDVVRDEIVSGTITLFAEGEDADTSAQAARDFMFTNENDWGDGV